MFSTLHTNDAPSAFTRLIDMGIEPFLVASTVEGVMAQRLVRTICPDCKVEYDAGAPRGAERLPAAGRRAAAAVEGDRLPGVPPDAASAAGSGIYELMVTGDTIREMCVQRVNASAIRNQALKDGMITLRQDGWRKVLKGKTTIDEVARVDGGRHRC